MRTAGRPRLTGGRIALLLALCPGATACLSTSFEIPAGPHAGQGRLTVEPSRVPAAGHRRFLFRYTPGPAGLFSGGGFRVRLPIDPVHPWMGFFRPRAGVGDERGKIVCVVWRGGEFVRPARAVALPGNWAACLLESGRLADGEELVLGYWTLAPRAAGRYQVEASSRLTGGQGGRPIEAPPWIDVGAGAARVLKAVGPSQVIAGRPFDLALVGLDEFGNRAGSLRGAARVTAGGWQGEARFDEEAAGVALLPGVRLTQEGFHWPEVAWQGKGAGLLTMRGHPIRVVPESSPEALETILWGDGAPPAAPSTGEPGAVEAYARDVSRLDFMGDGADEGLEGAALLYSWRSRGAGYDDDLSRLEPDASWLERQPEVEEWAVMAGSGGYWGRPGLDNETDLEPGAGGLTARVSPAEGIADRGWATSGERIYLRASRQGGTIRIVTAGCAPLEAVEVIVVDRAGRHVLAAGGRGALSWEGEVALPGGEGARLAYVRVRQRNGEMAWSSIWNVGRGAQDR